MSDYMRNRKSLSSIADAYRAMYAKPNEEILNEELIDSIIEDVREEEIEDIAKYLDENKDLDEGALADKAKKSGISVGTLRKVYNRGMAAWKTGHSPGTTPQQWGMARVNAFISKKKSGKLNHDQDLAHIVHPDDSMLDEAMKLAQIVRKHKSALMKAKRTGNLDLPKKVEDDLSNWASNNGEIKGDDPDEFDDWIDNNIDELVPVLKIKEEVELSEAMSKQMTVQQYANKVGIDAKEKQWIIDNEKDIVVYKDNSKTGGWSALGYPIRDNDYYFAFLGRDTKKGRTAASRANMMMNNYLKAEFAKARKLEFDGEPYTEDMIASHLWNFMSKEFDKLPKDLGAGDTMTREELYRAIYSITNGGEPQFESYDYQGETIQEGMLSGIVGKIVNKIRSARKKVGKKIKLGKKAKSPQQLKASHCSESKYDANILKSVADTYASMQNYGIQGDIVEGLEEVNSVMSVDKKNMPKAKPMIQKLARARGVPVSFDKDGIGVTFKGRPQDVDKLMKDFEKNKTLMKLLEETQLDEVQKVEVDAMKKVSKDMQKVLKAYQAIANKGDKELKDTKHNFEYKQVLQARDTILSMIGKLNTKMIIQQKMKKEDMMSEASAGAMIDKLFNLKGDKMAGYGVAKMLNMTGVKVVQQMQKQNPQGFLKTVQALGRDNKIKLSTNKALMKMFKDAGVKPLPEGLEERVKDGKLDPLSKMGKSKLTGSEINQYYRDNPKQKAAARDKSVKKAIELALDLSGATNYAIKEIEKFKKGLSKHPAVKLALRHANESKEFTGHHVVIENLSPANVVKLKTFGKMMAKMTKLPFDENDPEKSIDKLMGQIWKQKHVPANWERLHKMVAMLRDIGVKMPSLKGKYMGLDPVTKKAIFYKEGTDEIVEWHQKIEDIKEEIEELVEKSEMKDADVKKIAQMTDRNDHNGSLMHLAKLIGNKKAADALKGIIQTHKALGHMPSGLIDTRKGIYNDLMKQAKSKYSNYNDIYKSF